MIKPKQYSSYFDQTPMKMRSKTKAIFLIILGSLCCLTGFGQVLPGDANNDGIVDNLDILYVGYAFGSYGPSRVETNTEPAVQDVAIFWEQNFPDSLNFAFADSNGDGLVDTKDLITVVNNFGTTTERTDRERIQPGIRGFDPPLNLDRPNIFFPITAESQLSIPISLGTEEFSIPNFSGIAYSVEFDPDAIDTIRMDFQESWINPDNSSFNFQFPNPNIPNQLEVASTRFGPDIIDGSGVIGALSIVIEDDLIEFLPGVMDSAITIIKIKDILVIDHAFRKIPIAGDSIQFMVYHPRFLTSTDDDWVNEFEVFPTIANDHFWVEGSQQIKAVRLFNTAGQLIAQHQYPRGTYELQFSCLNAPEGSYFARIYTEKGAFSKPIFIRH